MSSSALPSTLLLLTTAVLAAGCLGGATPPRTDAALVAPSTLDVASPWPATGRIELYRHDRTAGALPSVRVCDDLVGAPNRYERNPDLVPNDTGAIEVTVVNDDSAPGIQVGTRLDDGPVHWLDPVEGGARTFTVPVLPGQTEDAWTRMRWSFVHRPTLAGQPAECYSGPMGAAHDVLIEAVRGPPPP